MMELAGFPGKAIFIRRDLRGPSVGEVRSPGQTQHGAPVGPLQPMMDKSRSKRDLTQ